MTVYIGWADFQSQDTCCPPPVNTYKMLYCVIFAETCVKCALYAFGVCLQRCFPIYCRWLRLRALSCSILGMIQKFNKMCTRQMHSLLASLTSYKKSNPECRRLGGLFGLFVLLSWYFGFGKVDLRLHWAVCATLSFWWGAMHFVVDLILNMYAGSL